ncbi:MAG: DUF2834 domain-containing protein [Candidatus Thermoplasmatota archaeon]|nr:DUF2834 domain-containing protein [Candidatus Thermoplasmatota archaeon]
MEFRWNRLFLVLWAILLLYTLFLAPGSINGSVELLKDMFMDPGSVEPMVFAMFNLMGVLPAAYSAVLLFEGRTGLRSWPFVAGSFFAGAFSLLLYLGLRKPQRAFKGKKGPLLRILDSRTYGIVLKLVGVSLIAYGLGAGNLSDFWELFRTNMLVNVMTLDFLILAAVFPHVIRDDMHRRGIGSSRAFWIYALIPVLGPFSYLWTRPQLENE